MRMLAVSVAAAMFSVLAGAQPPAKVTISLPGAAANTTPQTQTVGLGDTVVLRAPAAGTLGKPVRLFIDGIDSKIDPTGIDPAKHLYVFQLARTAENKELWRKLLRDPLTEPRREIRLSVGVENGKPLDSDAVLKLEKFRGGLPALFFTAFTVALVVLLFYYGSTTDMLRNGPKIGGVPQAYSLGRWQMAWWFFWIIVTYIGIWLITGDRDTVTTSLLALMGISAATALGSVMIDSTQPARDAARREQLQQEKASLEATKSQLLRESAAGASEAAGAADARVQQINQQIAATTRPPLSKDWLTDVLTDDSGAIALHRFQIVAWTIVLGIIFLFTALRDLTMPEFNPTLLALMGISAGTYLGFKFPGPAA